MLDRDVVVTTARILAVLVNIYDQDQGCSTSVRGKTRVGHQARGSNQCIERADQDDMLGGSAQAYLFFVVGPDHSKRSSTRTLQVGHEVHEVLAERFAPLDASISACAPQLPRVFECVCDVDS